MMLVFTRTIPVIEEALHKTQPLDCNQLPLLLKQHGKAACQHPGMLTTARQHFAICE